MPRLIATTITVTVAALLAAGCSDSDGGTQTATSSAGPTTAMSRTPPPADPEALAAVGQYMDQGGAIMETRDTAATTGRAVCVKLRSGDWVGAMDVARNGGPVPTHVGQFVDVMRQHLCPDAPQ